MLLAGGPAASAPVPAIAGQPRVLRQQPQRAWRKLRLMLGPGRQREDLPRRVALCGVLQLTHSTLRRCLLEPTAACCSESKLRAV